MSSTNSSADGVKVIQLLDDIISKANKARASDIHITPRESRYQVRFRVDGVMVDRPPLPLILGQHVTSRIKVLAKMDIADRMIPQDGVFTHEPEDAARISLRCSTFPSFHGEKIVMRLLSNRRLPSIPKLGVSSAQEAQLKGFTKHHGGLLLVTGPTGSGKTSTLYAMLRNLNTRRRNVVTLEDPIEVELRDVVQGQLNRKRGFDFANGLRAILRQDPDVIMVGEMRDAETAMIAVQASLTGHLVLSTMHTNSVPDTITRLVDLGLPPYVVASSLLGVVTQRLVRTICPECKVRETPARLLQLLPSIGFRPEDGIEYHTGMGCAACLDTGYKGRTGIFEVVPADDDLRRLIKSNASAREYKVWLGMRGVPTLRRQGMEVVKEGRTSLEEVLRLT